MHKIGCQVSEHTTNSTSRSNKVNDILSNESFEGLNLEQAAATNHRPTDQSLIDDRRYLCVDWCRRRCDAEVRAIVRLLFTGNIYIT